MVCRHDWWSPNGVIRPVDGSRIADRFWLVFACLLLAGCAALPQPQIEPVTITQPEDFPTTFYQRLPDSEVYQVGETSLVLKTYRAGWLKGLAHAHVMTTDTLTGLIRVDPQGSASRADLYFRPYDLVLDDPAMRAAAGEEFASSRSTEDIAATRLRMLGPRQLDSNSYPFVQIRVLPAASANEVLLEISIKDYVTTKPVPVSWQLGDGRLQLTSEFQLRHSELGLQRYSAFAGALAVAEEVAVTLTLTASQRDLSAAGL